MKIDKIIRELKYKISLIDSSNSIDYIKAINLQNDLMDIYNMLAEYLKGQK